jgi:hypothetical protein
MVDGKSEIRVRRTDARIKAVDHVYDSGQIDLTAGD